MSHNFLSVCFYKCSPENVKEVGWVVPEGPPTPTPQPRLLLARQAHVTPTSQRGRAAWMLAHPLEEWGPASCTALSWDPVPHPRILCPLGKMSLPGGSPQFHTPPSPPARGILNLLILAWKFGQELILLHLPTPISLASSSKPLGNPVSLQRQAASWPRHTRCLVPQSQARS